MATPKPKILAVIQARSGSKGIPKKNIYPILGHPLMAYSIQAALDSKMIDHVVVTTDSEAFAQIARDYGAEAPFLRPPELSGDKVHSVDSLYHAVLKTEEIKGMVYDYIVELPCVSPLRNGVDVDGALQKLIETGADSIISLADTGEKHPTRLKKIVDDQILDFTAEYPEPKAGTRRQDLTPPSYIRNGAIYAMTRTCLIDGFSRHGENSRPFVMPGERSVNIDTVLDLQFAAFLIQAGYCQNRPVKRRKVAVERVHSGKPYRLLVTTPTHFLPQIRTEMEQLVDCTYAYGADRDLLLSLLPDADAWICSPCPTFMMDGALLKNAPKLKILATPSTGSNHIDKAWCKQNGVAFACLKGTEIVNTIQASSEFTWALLMAVQRRLPLAVEKVKQGFWRDVEDELRAVEFHGKTLGIIGYGRIGSNVARYANAFHMKIIAHDPFKTITAPYVEQAPDHQTVLARADMVLISVHLDETTTAMVDQTWFAAMKPGACFINISRGEIVVDAALLSALDSGHLAAAGLDVISDEFLSDKLQHPLIRYAKQHENLIITPHIAGLTVDSEATAATFAFSAVRKQLGLD